MDHGPWTKSCSMNEPTMQAAYYDRYGPPEVISIREVPRPLPAAGQYLIRQHASSVDSGDWRLRKADPFLVRLFFGLFKPKYQIPGIVVSGEVLEAGPGAGKFRNGDAVFGMADLTLGAHAEYVIVRDTDAMAAKPENLTFEEAAALPFGAHTALHFLREAGLAAGHHILIYGASGAVGTAAVQLAKAMGARVTGVCSGRNADLVRSLGADRVIDYTKEDVTRCGETFDVVFETVNKLPVPAVSRLVKPQGALALSAAGILGGLQGAIASKRRKFRLIAGVANAGPDDMAYLAGLAAEGRLKPVIDKTWNIRDIAEAHRYAEGWHKRGSILVTW